MSILTRIADHVGWAVLDRPRTRNAFDGPMIAAMIEALRKLIADTGVRIVGLRSEGDVFSAGADLAWMKRMASASSAENMDDARQLAELMRLLDTCPKPVIVRVQGAALGGAVGLIACCDIAVASEEAVFGLSEVRLGLIPAVISPYVVRAIGARMARRLFLTGERISAAEARRIGLIHEVASASQLDAAASAIAASLLAGGPEAQSHAKELIAGLLRPVNGELIEMTASRIAAIRASSEAQEGLAAFLERRKPKWRGE